MPSPVDAGQEGRQHDQARPIAQPGLVAEFEARLPAMLDELGDLVRCESPSADLAALERSADAVAALGQRLTGWAPEVIADAGPTHLRWTFGDGPRGCCWSAITTRCGPWARSTITRGR